MQHSDNSNDKKSTDYVLNKNDEIIDFLKSSRLFAQWPQRIFLRLIPLSSFEDYKEGETILMEGQENDKVYFLVRGTVSIFADNQFILDLKRRGDIFGEMSVITEKATTASVIAKTQVRVFSISASHIGHFTGIDADELNNTLYRFFAMILTDKLLLTTYKAKEYELSQKDLKKAKRQAEQANKCKSDFIANVSHELRTPMHHILNYSRIGVKKFNTAKKNKLLHYFRQIRTTGERLLKLINDILDIEKMESGKIRYEKSRADIVEIAGDIMNEFAMTAEKKAITLQFNQLSQPESVYCDKDRIGQVIRNLLSNAIKFSPDNSTVSLSVRVSNVILGKRKDDKDSVPGVQIDIEDQGIGIPPDELKDIFEKFIQSSKTDSSTTGTGLGLSICKEIVESHMGHIWAKNRESTGAVFSVNLPYSH